MNSLDGMLLVLVGQLREELRDDGHDDHVEHVVQQQGYTHDHQHQAAL